MPDADPARPELAAALDPAGVTVPGWRVEVLDASPSTNAEVARRAREGAEPGLVVAAEHQTAGRGRLDRVWVTPPRVALTFSALVVPAVPLGRWPWLPLLTGLAVVDAVRRTAGVEATLKWPNDVLAGDAKLAGILVELVDRPGGPAAVVGVGVNVSATREQLPSAAATSLALSGATSLDRTALLGEALTGLSQHLRAWSAAGGEGPRASYRQACSTLGRDVRVTLPGGAWLTGRAVDVDEEGRLLVDDGERTHALGAGDVVHVRAG